MYLHLKMNKDMLDALNVDYRGSDIGTELYIIE
jgi:hypothetical protein